MVEHHNNLTAFNRYFEGYSENIPVIFSTLEGQYPGVVYYDEKCDIAILATKFGFVYIGGDVNTTGAGAFIDDILFHELAQRQNIQELIAFGQNNEWNNLLDYVFKSHHGVVDVRKYYRLSRDKFEETCNAMNPNSIDVLLMLEQDNGSTVKYPVARVYRDGIDISYCSAFMLARGFAEIDVGTKDGYRQKGYGKIASITLMNSLLHQGIEPCWCTWPYRTESQALAKSIGFELYKEIPAYIWVSEFEN